MTQRRYSLLLAIAMTVAAASLSGCGSAGTGHSSTEQSQVAKADVTISARFPAAGEVTKSLIPANAQVIEVYAYQIDSGNPSTLIATLTPAAPTQSVKMGAGLYNIYATAFDSADPATRRWLGQTSTGGEVKMGVINSVNLTFLDGQWTIVNDVDVPTPLVLSNGTQLIDFIVGGQQYGYPAKSSIDYSKPVGGGGGTVRLRFDNNTSARTYGMMASQFIGSTASTLLASDGYNLTKKCGFDNYYGLPCDDTAGDQIVMISGKDTGDYQSGGSYEGNLLSGSAEMLLPNGGKTSFTQGGVPIDLATAFPDTVVTSGNTIAGGIVEWKPSTNRATSLGVPLAKAAKSVAALAVKAQSANTPYTNITVKETEILVCSGSNPQNRGTWSFANNTSAGKVVLGSRVCYTNYPYLSSYNPITYQTGTDKGDYSYGLDPGTDLGDYCHQWDYAANVCLQQAPLSNEVYLPYNFKSLKSAAKSTINYGTFKLLFWGESSQTGSAYIYPFRAKGSTTVKTAPAAPVITSIGVPASVAVGTGTASLTASAFDPNGDTVTWSWSIVSGGGVLGSGCSGAGPGSITSSCSYTPPTAAASVVLRFTVSDGVKSNSLNRTLSVSDGTTVYIQ